MTHTLRWEFCFFHEPKRLLYTLKCKLILAYANHLKGGVQLSLLQTRRKALEQLPAKREESYLWKQGLEQLGTCEVPEGFWTAGWWCGDTQ